MAHQTDTKTVQNLKDRGFLPWKVEVWNPYAKRKNDAFGFLDYIAVKGDEPGVLGVQTTTKANISTRIKKAEGIDAYWEWLAAGNPVEFHGWYKKGARWAVEIRRVERP